MAKDLDALFRDGFLGHGMDEDPQASRQIDEGR
jgi:hypothetical protein